MIKQSFILDRANGWKVTCFYAVTHYDAEEIIKELYASGADERDIEKAYSNVSSGHMNIGLCYSGENSSVLVVSVSSSPSQFFNTLFHEVHHLSNHIAMKLGYNLKGEFVCYLAGDIAENMCQVVLDLL